MTLYAHVQVKEETEEIGGGSRILKRGVPVSPVVGA